MMYKLISSRWELGNFCRTPTAWDDSGKESAMVIRLVQGSGLSGSVRNVEAQKAAHHRKEIGK